MVVADVSSKNRVSELGAVREHVRVNAVKAEELRDGVVQHHLGPSPRIPNLLELDLIRPPTAAAVDTVVVRRVPTPQNRLRRLRRVLRPQRP